MPDPLSWIMPLRDVVGHAQLIRLLGEAVGRGRTPQSLLFAGPDGVGKRTTAMALAQAVNCPENDLGGGVRPGSDPAVPGSDPGLTPPPRSFSADACGVCATCQRIARGQHSDVTVISRGDEASIKIRALRE